MKISPNAKIKFQKKPNLGDLANLSNLCNKILIFGSQMKPKNLYLMTSKSTRFLEIWATMSCSPKIRADTFTIPASFLIERIVLCNQSYCLLPSLVSSCKSRYPNICQNYNFCKKCRDNAKEALNYKFWLWDDFISYCYIIWRFCKK